MVFNKEINGFENEIEFCNELNNKKVHELNPLFRGFNDDLYGNVCENDIVKCMVSYDKKKYDIKISINSIEKNISIKKRYKNVCSCRRDF